MPKGNSKAGLIVLTLGIIGLGGYYLYKNPEIIGIARQSSNNFSLAENYSSAGSDSSNAMVLQEEQDSESKNDFIVESDSGVSEDIGSITDSPIQTALNNLESSGGSYLLSVNAKSSSGSGSSSSSGGYSNSNSSSKNNISALGPVITKTSESNVNTNNSSNNSLGSKIGNAVKTAISIVKTSPVKSVIKLISSKK